MTAQKPEERDIVERLRWQAWPPAQEAADVIERLRAKENDLRHYEGGIDRLQAEIERLQSALSGARADNERLRQENAKLRLQVRELVEAPAGWLIEHPNSTRYVTLRAGTDDAWTTDNEKALRFARRQDAEDYWAFYGDDCFFARIVEHAWG